MGAHKDAAIKSLEAKRVVKNDEALALAQVHATLELAEQQRIANAIAVLTIPQSALDEKDPHAAKTTSTRERVERRNALAAMVREGMDLV